MSYRPRHRARSRHPAVAGVMLTAAAGLGVLTLPSQTAAAPPAHDTGPQPVLKLPAAGEAPVYYVSEAKSLARHAPQLAHAAHVAHVAHVSAAQVQAPVQAPVQAQVTAQVYGSSPGSRALAWAEAHETGAWYAWGGTGPDAYDCSGAVYEAFLQAAGIDIGRDTYDMLGSWGNGHFRQVPLDATEPGDLLFFGSGHVMFATGQPDMAFGALDYGTQVGWHRWYPGYWAPTMAIRVER